ncbi:MAG TPA: tetratricopeptide repeat protein, partial [Acidobacteriaceae bacterium]|nr:tetratricopeptide repeat protein [Acidobacteriaceae bacterium]
QSDAARTLTSEEIDALWTIGRPAEGCERLRAALDAHPGSADELRTQMARALGLQGRFDEAWGELARVSENPSVTVRIRVQLESGRLRNSSGDREGSREYFMRALALAEEGGFDYFAVDAAHMLGIVSGGDASIEWNRKALDLAAHSNDERARRWKGSLLNNLGWAWFDRGDFAQALGTFEEALRDQEATGNPVRIRVLRWSVARCLRALHRYEDALAIQSELSQYPEEGFVSEELGELLLAMGRPEEARPYFRKAYPLLARRLGSDSRESSRLERLKALSE